MKRIISLLLVSILTLSSAFGDELNQEQTEVRNDLYNFVKEEGYVPEIDLDGDVKFKIEGKTYYFHVSATDTNPFFVTFFVEYSYQDNYSKEQLILADHKLNLFKGIKVLLLNNVFRITAELYVRNAEPVKTAFYKLKDQMVSLESDVIEECANTKAVAGLPFTASEFKVANVDKDNVIISDYDAIIYDFKTKYLKLRFTAKPHKTGTFTVKAKLYKDEVLQRNSTTSPPGYTFSTTLTFNDTSTKTVSLCGWGSENAGNWAAGEYRYELWDDDNNCLGTKKFKIY